MNRWTMGIGLINVVWMTGCAFTPQRIELSPLVRVSSVDHPSGLRVGVRVRDERAQQILGHRGSAMGNGAKITTDQDVSIVVKDRIVEGLKSKGYVPVEPADEKARQFNVEIRLLNYTTSIGFWTGGVHTSAALKLIARNGADSYENLYRVENERRVVFVPTAKTNAVWMNATLTEVLEQMFADKGWLTLFNK